MFETAPDSGGGVPGAWTSQYTEAWNTTSIPLASMLFELKAGTWQSEANAPGTVIFDNFMAAVPGSGGGLDTTKSNNTVFSGTQNTSVPLADTNGQLQIGALFQNTAGSNYNGITSKNAYNFTGAYSYVELVQPPASNTAADAMLV